MSIKLKKPVVFNRFTEDDYLKAALEATAWIQSYERPTEYGKIWRQCPDVEEDMDHVSFFETKCLYGGSSGIGIYFIRLYQATGEQKWLDEAIAAADHIVATYEGTTYYDKLNKPVDGLFQIKGWSVGVFCGPVGEGLFLELLYKVTGEQKYRDYALQVAEDVLSIAIEDEKGIHWTNESDVNADASFILYLLLLYRDGVKDQRYLDIVEKAADYITATKTHESVHGTYWDLVDISKIGLGFPEGCIFPNFAHGTAGIGFVYALIYEETKKEKYLDLARTATQFLQNIAVGDENGKLIPYMYNPSTGEHDENIYYLSQCHGPAGTFATFKKMYEVTGEEEYLTWMKDLSRGIVCAGAPEQNTPGYWNSLCLCCGSPGILEHFAYMYEITGEEEFLDYAKRTAATIIGDSYIGEEDHLRRWYGAWTRKIPKDVQSYTGLYVGTAGAAFSLVKLYAVIKGIKTVGSYEYCYFDD